jgi:hypothetical protein
VQVNSGENILSVTATCNFFAVNLAARMLVGGNQHSYLQQHNIGPTVHEFENHCKHGTLSMFAHIYLWSD